MDYPCSSLFKTSKKIVFAQTVAPVPPQPHRSIAGKGDSLYYIIYKIGQFQSSSNYFSAVANSNNDI